MVVRFRNDQDELMLQCEYDRVGVAPDVEGFHDAMLMELHSFFAQVQEASDLLIGAPLSEHLIYFSLAGGQFI